MTIRFCLAAVLLMPTAAMAQGNPGPYGALFGRAPVRTGLEQTIVEIRTGLGAHYDTDLLAPEGSIDTTEAGVGSGAFAGLMATHMTSRFNASLRGGVGREQYFRLPESFGVNRYGADARVGGKFTDRWEGSAAASYAFSPYYQFFRDFGYSRDSAIDTTFVPFSSPYAVEMLQNEAIEASAGLTGRVTDRSTLSATVNRRQTHFTQQPDSNFDSSGYGARWNLQVQRGLAVYAGYTHEKVHAAGAVGGGYDHEVIDAGVDFNRALSLSRRTTLAFSTSTSMIKQAGSEHQIRLNGSVVLSKYFRRTWRASAEASRTTEFMPGFVEPVYADYFGASVSGMFSPRLNWMAGVGAARGESAFTGRPVVDTVTAATRLSIALTRHVEMFGQYSTHFSDVLRGATTVGLRGRTARQVVSVGIGAYIPVYGKTRAGQ